MEDPQRTAGLPYDPHTKESFFWDEPNLERPGIQTLNLLMFTFAEEP